MLGNLSDLWSQAHRVFRGTQLSHFPRPRTPVWLGVHTGVAHPATATPALQKRTCWNPRPRSHKTSAPCCQEALGVLHRSRQGWSEFEVSLVISQGPKSPMPLGTEEPRGGGGGFLLCWPGACLHHASLALGGLFAEEGRPAESGFSRLVTTEPTSDSQAQNSGTRSLFQGKSSLVGRRVHEAVATAGPGVRHALAALGTSPRSARGWASQCDAQDQ